MVEMSPVENVRRNQYFFKHSTFFPKKMNADHGQICRNTTFGSGENYMRQIFRAQTNLDGLVHCL